MYIPQYVGMVPVPQDKLLPSNILHAAALSKVYLGKVQVSQILCLDKINQMHY